MALRGSETAQIIRAVSRARSGPSKWAVDGLSGDFVDRIFEDREGNIWLTTPNGLDRFREYQSPQFREPGSLKAVDARLILADIRVMHDRNDEPCIEARRSRAAKRLLGQAKLSPTTHET